MKHRGLTPMFHFMSCSGLMTDFALSLGGRASHLKFNENFIENSLTQHFEFLF